MRTKVFASKSTPGVQYTTGVDDNGQGVCNCPGYTMNSVKTGKPCTHIKQMGGTSVAGFAAQPTMFEEVTAPVGFIEPMLASALKEGASFEDFDPATHVMEIKYDGHRMLVLKEGERVTCWSREGLVQDAVPAQVLRGIRENLPDGFYDGERFIPGGTATDVKAKHLQHLVRYAIFDILAVNKQSCETLPGVERRELLEVACSQIPLDCAIELAAQMVPSKEALDAFWDAGGEGVIVKRKRSTYVPGRRSPEWIKFKKPFAAEVIIIGFEGGLLGPHAKVVGQHEDGTRVTVKSLNDAWRAMFAKDEKKYIGRTLVISHFGRTKGNNKFVSPMADHIL